jgi:enediyne biosynthesis protein E4
LDIYLANYRVSTARDEPHLGFTISQEGGKPKVTAYGGRPISEASLSNRFKFHSRPTASGGGTVFHDEQGEPDTFLRNDGGGRFVPISFTSGMFLDEAGQALPAPLYDWGLSALMRDLNGDGATDLYVCNDFSSPDRIWINDGRGRLRALPALAIRQSSLSTMAVDVADIDRDGHDDIFTADMLSPERWRRLVQRNQANPNMHFFVDVASRPQSPRNMLQRNRGDGTYQEIARLLGLEASEWSWASAFIDVDLDGYEDLLVANGFERDFMNMDANRRVRAAQARVPRDAPVMAKLAANRLYPRLATANLAYRNINGWQFRDVSQEWGFDVAAVSQGMGLADLDNDGDLDVAINNLNSAATLLRNETVAPRVAIRLRGRTPNTQGVGARIQVLGGPVARQSQEMIAAGRYLSGDDTIRVFAAGSLNARLTVEVRWRDGQRTILSNLPPNGVYEIAQIGAGSSPAPSDPPSNRAPAQRPLFANASHRLNHIHQPVPVDDFAGQLMMPARLSSLGPGVSWLDVDGDGWDDLVLAGPGESGPMIFRNDLGTGFKSQPAWAPEAGISWRHPATSIVGWRGVQSSTLLAGVDGSRSDGATNYCTMRALIWGAGPISTETKSSSAHSTGPLALADVDQDGDLDAFVGGRFVPGQWPEAAGSTLFFQDQGRWFEPAARPNPFAGAGLVAGAIFTDLDNDGDPDLALSTDWGPLRIYINDGGRFSPKDWPLTWGQRSNAAPRLSQLTGWWTGLDAGDFDGDGRIDLVAGNLGRNSDYERYLSRPVRVYYGRFAGDESMNILECAFDPGLNRYAALSDVWTLSKSLPWLLAKFESYEKFARASVEEILGEHLAGARHLEASWPESTVFLNRGGHFEARPLPREAQLAPAWSVVINDFDGDSREDLFLAQNFFGGRSEASRLDAGRGLLLRGDGRGDFTAVSGQESGLEITGDQRGAAVADFDRDGRIDLAVAQHGASTRLFRNQAGRPGLRVRLLGEPGNPGAVGAVVRVGDGQSWGPAREVHAGSGYWSQNSFVQVLARPAAEARIQVRWPGGKITERPVAKDQREIVVPAVDGR